ncbi:type I polyketide synthase [Mycobacterium angelicum]|uniref:type I polyketide synthase n=1 Tax=Mycobacterium angelicum TaxID=470074 RepID=UPI00111C07AD|nr:type I polyketide synthase [Mycobacterium angelicum]MCV7195318.1 acyltransferase domain-containing protein [Mycobacterium angelicum]
MQPTDIAIIGLACRFPGAANPRDFWQLLRDGREATGSIDNLADFDAGFFNLSPREACAMDPRQRLALELTWELFEDAFVVPQDVRGRQVAVYLGAMNDDYAFLTLRDAADTLDHHSFAGSNRAMIANRVSYAFGLRGVSMVVDSAQSSSLAAVHLACESLRAGAAELAIAGGIQLNLAPEIDMLESESGALSVLGHTYAFDERADGYVRGEGGGVVLLKPLPAAVADGNRIHAVILGSALGNAGHSAPGLTVPSAAAEAEIIRQALSSAGVDHNQIDYVEAHGTGTQVGDPIEAAALGEIFAERSQRPAAVGSVATNIGNAGAAAGIAGLLKAVLALENGLIPASLNYVSPSTDVESFGLRVNAALTPWPEAQPRRAGVSSFGMGGTNAHVILQQAPGTAKSAVAEYDSVAVPWVLSARSSAALVNQAQRLLAWIEADHRLSALDVGWTLASTRSAFEHRAVVVGATRAQLSAGLAELAGADHAPDQPSQPSRKIAFVFAGHGWQWPGVGHQLYQRFPAFAAAFDEVADALDAQLRVPLRQVIWGTDAELLQSAEFTRPAVFAVEVALATLLREWGVTPEVVLGQSVGEVAAAYIAGVLSLPEAATVLTQGKDEFLPTPAQLPESEPRIELVSDKATAESLGANVFVEVGPDAGLTAESLLSALGRLFTAGVNVNWPQAFAGMGAHRVDLPTYGFARQRYWLGGTRADQADSASATLATLADLPAAEQRRKLVELVCGHAAIVLGHPDSRNIDPERAFEELGFGSMTGVELRNRLTTATGLVLSRTLIFDYPTPAALAAHLGYQLSGSPPPASDDENMWAMLRNIPIQELRRTGLLDKLLLLAGQSGGVAPDPTVSDDVIDSLSPEALIEMALNPDPNADDEN